jgi:hypothetical protein
MTRSILRVVLTTLALVMLFAGSHNLNRTRAQDGYGMFEESGSACDTYCGCGGGQQTCCRIEYPNGPKVYCGMPMPQ